MKNLKPFNLEEAMNGAELVTRDGRQARFLYLLKNDRFQDRVLIIVNDDDNREILRQHMVNGRYYSENIETCHDLFMKPKTKKLFIRVDNFSGGDGYHYTSSAHPILDKVTLLDETQIVEIEIEV